MSEMIRYYQRRIEESEADIETLRAKRDVTSDPNEKDRVKRRLESVIHDISMFREAIERLENGDIPTRPDAGGGE